MSSETGTRHYRLRKRADAMDATRRRITEAAVELHGSLGPARTTITGIAERAGVQRQTVYRHFPTDDDLLAACSGHFAALHPVPDLERWRAIADPAERVNVALTELYAYWEETEEMWTNVLRDATLVEAVGRASDAMRGYLDEAARTLAAGWGARGRRRTMLDAATRHAVDFHTWRSLAHQGGISREEAAKLSAAMVLAAT